MCKNDLHFQVSLAVAEALTVRRPFTALRLSDGTPLSAPRTFNTPELSYSDIMCIEDLRRRKVNSRIKANQFRAKLRNLITRFPVRVQYFGYWHK